jgi:hypothetical protein
MRSLPLQNDTLIKQPWNCVCKSWTCHVLKNFWRKILHLMAYLPHAGTVEPQKQLLLSNTRTQQQNNGVMQPVSRKRLRKHVPKRNNGNCVSVVECCSSLLGRSQSANELGAAITWLVFSVWSVRSLYNEDLLWTTLLQYSAVQSTRTRMEHVLSELRSLAEYRLKQRSTEWQPEITRRLHSDLKC